jgi:hypothetical protein
MLQIKQAYGFERDKPSSAFAYFSLNGNRTSHLFNQTFANAQSESDSKLIASLMLVDFVEVNKQRFELIFGNPAAKVLDLQFKVHVVLLVLIV